jgi:hypothetical protein
MLKRCAHLANPIPIGLELTDPQPPRTLRRLPVDLQAALNGPA